MTANSISADVSGLRADVLDHSREFVELVYRQAPGAYRSLLSTGRFRDELSAGSNFNFGQLYAYAEFTVFRQEFARRFPEASTAACINAFSKLFLKNDISISNLVEHIEGPGDPPQPLLTRA
jgi:hypothetical protein